MIRQNVRRLVCETSKLDAWIEKSEPEPELRSRPVRNRRDRLRSRSPDHAETREVSPRLLEIRERRRRRELGFENPESEKSSKFELELTKDSENGKLESGKPEGTGDDVWKIIQSRTPEPLLDSEDARQEKENVNLNIPTKKQSLEL